MLQTIFINDYPWRKLIILLPFFLLLVASGSQMIWRKWVNLKKTTMFSLGGLGIMFLMLLLYWEQVFFSTHVFPLVTTVFGIFLMLFAGIKRTKSEIVPILLFVLLMLPEVYYSIQHYIINPTYYYKNMYKSLSEYDGHKFIGGSSMGFRVYNETVPLLSKYHYYGRMDEYWRDTEKLSRNGQKDYSIDYDFMEEEYKKIGFRPVKIIMPTEKSVWLHDIVLYEEIEIK